MQCKLLCRMIWGPPVAKRIWRLRVAWRWEVSNQEVFWSWCRMLCSRVVGLPVRWLVRMGRKFHVFPVSSVLAAEFFAVLQAIKVPLRMSVEKVAIFFIFIAVSLFLSFFFIFFS